MKKTYTKPEIAFENFLMSTSIAGDCDIKTHTPSLNQCAYSYHDEFVTEGVNLFVDDVNACTTIEADGEYNGFCYHVFTGNSLFNS